MDRDSRTRDKDRLSGHSGQNEDSAKPLLWSRPALSVKCTAFTSHRLVQWEQDTFTLQANCSRVRINCAETSRCNRARVNHTRMA
ncbi:hypothetical protein CHARACLAT_017369 [Characodon lateralis]|uniref:Uncharacterized protein n=1 Tax=Characodon lateralis TaxID=208331 RepID=A0ABU7DRW5_9TELE|nr:hypothetical protein [Characodon lateralis]